LRRYGGTADLGLGANGGEPTGISGDGGEGYGGEQGETNEYQTGVLCLYIMTDYDCVFGGAFESFTCLKSCSKLNLRAGTF